MQNKVPHCSDCERCKSNQRFFDDIYCCKENEPLNIFRLLSVDSPPEISPEWCPKREKEKISYAV